MRKHIYFGSWLIKLAEIKDVNKQKNQWSLRHTHKLSLSPSRCGCHSNPAKVPISIRDWQLRLNNDLSTHKTRRDCLPSTRTGGHQWLTKANKGRLLKSEGNIWPRWQWKSIWFISFSIQMNSTIANCRLYLFVYALYVVHLNSIGMLVEKKYIVLCWLSQIPWHVGANKFLYDVVRYKYLVFFFWHNGYRFLVYWFVV